MYQRITFCVTLQTNKDDQKKTCRLLSSTRIRDGDFSHFPAYDVPDIESTGPLTTTPTKTKTPTTSAPKPSELIFLHRLLTAAPAYDGLYKYGMNSPASTVAA